MAKTGLAYYRADTERFRDRRIRKLVKSFGGLGYAVYEYILNEIYRDKGCFLEWDEDTAFDVAEYYGIKESVVWEIMRYCCAVGLFEKELLTSGRLLTSKSIQERYVDMCNAMRRTPIKIPDRVRIPPKIPEEKAFPPEEKAFPPEEINKVKESKGKESKAAQQCARDEIFSHSEIVYSEETRDLFDEVVVKWNQIPHVVKFDVIQVPEFIRAEFAHRLAEHGPHGICNAITKMEQSKFYSGKAKTLMSFKRFLSERFQDVLDGRYDEIYEHSNQESVKRPKQDAQKEIGVYDEDAQLRQKRFNDQYQNPFK